MRIVLIAVALLIAGCSHATVSEPEPTTTSGAGASRSPAASSTPTKSPTSTPSAPPRSGASIGDVIGWIESGRPVDVAQYHAATNGDETTELGDDVAFTAPRGASGATRCMTDSRYTGGALACLVDLADPPARPDDVYGGWKGNWVDFDGTSVQVGSAHSDPGPFRSGTGTELPHGAVLAFGDYRCRADHSDLFCVNYAHRSAVRLGSAGVEPFGCLRPAPAPEGVGRAFSC